MCRRATHANTVETDIAYAKALEVKAVPAFLWEVDDQWTVMVGVKKNYIDLMSEFIWRAPKLEHLRYISQQYTVVIDILGGFVAVHRHVCPDSNHHLMH